MASTTTVTITDDIDGSADAQTVTFALDGKSYEIDLSEENRSKLDKALADFIENARPAKGAAKPKPLTRAGNNKARLDAIREWARKNEYNVSDRGRIAGHIIEEYDAANK